MTFDVLIPRYSWRAIRIWQRNLSVYKKTYKTSLVPNFFEPMFYLFAFGYGLGMYIGKIGNLSYMEFLAPGLIISAGMWASAFECTYGSFIRMHYMKTYDAIISTPANLEDVVVGDLLWGATKSLIYGTIVLLVFSIMGLIHSYYAILIPFILILEGLLFSSISMTLTAIVPSVDDFNYFFTLGVTPMYLLSGIFFPLDSLPPSFKAAAEWIPLTPIVAVSQFMSWGSHSMNIIQGLIWVVVLIVVFFNLSVVLMKKRLIK